MFKREPSNREIKNHVRQPKKIWMKIKTILIGTVFTSLLVLGGMAIIGSPVNFWFTEDQQGDRQMALKRYDVAAETYVDPMRKGVALFREGQFEEAAAAFSRLDNADSAFNRGNSLVMLGKYENAISSYDRALQFNPQWNEAKENRALAIARRDKLAPTDDDSGGTGGQLKPDEIVFDDRAKDSSETQTVEVGSGEELSDQEIRELWLQRVQTSPSDFLRVKFSYQQSKRQSKEGE